MDYSNIFLKIQHTENQQVTLLPNNFTHHIRRIFARLPIVDCFDDYAQMISTKYARSSCSTKYLIECYLLVQISPNQSLYYVTNVYNWDPITNPYIWIPSKKQLLDFANIVRRIFG